MHDNSIIHPVWLRITHWINALAVLALMPSFFMSSAAITEPAANAMAADIKGLCRE